MKAALLMGNRFSSWHMQVYARLGEDYAFTAFRAHSEIQQYFRERDDPSLRFRYETIHFDDESFLNPFSKWMHRALKREPRMLPFWSKLQGFDLIQSWELFTDWTEQALIAKRKFGMPLAVMVWDTIPFNNEDSEYRRTIKQTAIAEADRFLVHSERSRRMLAIEGVAPERISFCHPGVDTHIFTPGAGDRAALGLVPGEFVILFVGWFLPRKGLHQLLLALSEVRRDPALRARKLRLLMVGSGPGKARIEALIARLGLGDCCTFAGSLPYDRMPNAYRCADLFVLPSLPTPTWQEQFAMSLIEAMACARPCLSTRSGAIPEIAGEAAALVQADDFVELAEALRALIADEARRAQLASAARARAEALFSLEGQADALRAVYGQLAKAADD